MNPNQRSEANNQSDNGGNELDVSSSRAGTADRGNLNKSQQGSQQRAARPEVRESNDVAGGYPKSPGGHHLAADRKMDDDTGLSNTVNRPPEIDDGERQEQQSNVGRRSDGTPD
jgi:hypothetical protein